MLWLDFLDFPPVVVLLNLLFSGRIPVDLSGLFPFNELLFFAAISKIFTIAFFYLKSIFVLAF
jgi:hypothetical protein